MKMPYNQQKNMGFDQKMKKKKHGIILSESTCKKAQMRELGFL